MANSERDSFSPSRRWEYDNGGLWDRGSFTVPDTTSEERGQFVAQKYMVKYGEALEAQGFTVKEMLKPQVDPLQSHINPGRRGYVMYARIMRRPVLHNFWVPDEAAPAIEKLGFRLK